MTPYLNELKLIANLAIKPELSLTDKGRRYCNFSVRLLYRDNKGNPIVDYVNATCYDEDAEMLVRDCGMGDLLFVNGYVTMMRWEARGQQYSKLVIIARSVQLLAVCGGMPSLDGENPGRWPYKGFMEGNELQYISSYSTDDKRPDSVKPDRNMYPQPLPDGTWKYPIFHDNRQNRPTQEFLKQHPEVLGKLKSPVAVESDIDMKIASQLISENLPVRMVKGERTVFLPDGHYMTERQYIGKIKAQREYLDGMPVEQRIRVLAIAEERFGFRSQNGLGLPAVATDEQIANALGAADLSNPENFRPLREGFADASVNTAEGLGDSEEDWYQDEKGEWHLRRGEETQGDGKNDGTTLEIAGKKTEV